MRLGNSRGSGIVMCLVSVVVLSALSITSYRLTQAAVKESLYQRRGMEAQAIAEAGMEDALYQLYLNSGWRTGFSQKPFFGGYYTVTLSTDNPPWITSKGYSAAIARFGRASRTIRLQSRINFGSGSSWGEFAQSVYSVAGTVDAYDSAINPQPSSFSNGANVWSNGEVRTSGRGIRIFGNVSYRTGAAPDPQNISGAIFQSTYSISLPVRDGSAYITNNDNATGLTPSSVYNAATKNVDIRRGRSATIRTGNYYFNNVDVKGTLNIDASSGPVVIYLAGDWIRANGDVINPTYLPSNFAIYGQAATLLDFSSPTALYAVVEAPLANVNINQIFYGRVIGNNVDVANRAAVHHDLQFGGGLQATHVDWQPGSWSVGY